LKAVAFDAVIDYSAGKSAAKTILSVKNEKYPVKMEYYSYQPDKETGRFYVHFKLSKSVDLKWNDPFFVLRSDKEDPLGEGRILYPHLEKITPRKEKKRVGFLMGLLEGNREVIISLIKEAGINGISGEEILELTSLSTENLSGLSQELESSGIIRILSFSPLCLLSQENFDILCEKIQTFLSKYHEKNSGESGVPRKKIQKKFDLHPRVLALALTSLARSQKIKDTGGIVALSDFKQILTSNEEEMLVKLEKLYLKGGFQSESLESLRQKFNIPTVQMDKLISLLVARKKIIQSEDGYLLHESWLEDVIQMIRSFPKEELTVADFKKMTGLSRKYAIPLLELMDQKNVTKRKGAVREILVKD